MWDSGPRWDGDCGSRRQAAAGGEVPRRAVSRPATPPEGDIPWRALARLATTISGGILERGGKWRRLKARGAAEGAAGTAGPGADLPAAHPGHIECWTGAA